MPAPKWPPDYWSKTEGKVKAAAPKEMPKQKGSAAVPVKAMPAKPPEALSKSQKKVQKPQFKKLQSPPKPAILPEPPFPPNPPIRPSGPLLGGFQSSFTEALRDLGLTPDEDRIDYAITQLSNAVWEKLKPRIDEEIFQAHIRHSRQGPELHAWNPNPVQREEPEEVEPAIIEDDPEEEEEADEEEEHSAWHNAWQDASWQDYDDNDDDAEEGQEPRREVVEDAVMLPASIEIHDSSNIQR